MNWTPSDGSRERQELGSASTSWDASMAEREDRRTQSGLQGINDFDFEALIEILGTNGAEKANDLNAGNVLLQVNEERSVEEEDTSAGRSPTASDTGATRKSPGQNASVVKSPPLSALADPSTPISPLNLPSASCTSRRKPAVEVQTSTAGPSRPKAEQLPRPARRTETKIDGGFSQLGKELGSAVEETKEGIAELRKRIQALKEEVKGFAPQLYHKAFENRADEVKRYSTSKNPKADEDNNKKSDARGPLRVGAEELKESSIAMREEISKLSGEEAKDALAKICLALGLNISSVLASPPLKASSCSPPSLRDVGSALNFVADVDRLVWRRNGGGSANGEGAGMQDLYAEQNLTAMFERIRLWERTARSRTGR